MTPEAYCEERGAPPGSSRYYFRLFLPEPQRSGVTALYALCHEVGSIADEVSEIGAARVKLGWWQEEIERLYAREPRHPVTRALQAHVEWNGLRRALFDQFLAAADMDIDPPGYADREALLVYARRHAAAQRLESEICGGGDPAVDDFAESLGIALRLARVLQDVRADAARGRVYLPQDRLEAHGVKPGELVQAETPPHLRALLEEEAAGVVEQIEHALQRLPADAQHAQQSGLVAAAIERRLLAEIERDGYRLLEHRIDLTPLRKFWIAWRTVRRARRSAARPD